MKVEIISTGEEVLSGQIIDTNASWISARLTEHGIEVSRRLTIGDRFDDLVASFSERSLVADIVLVTGGLGPTSDDMSSEAMAQAIGEPLRIFPEWVAALQERFASQNRTMDPHNTKQAFLPDSATVLHNPIGTACGFKVKLNRATFYFMPGVPAEMKKMLSEIVLPEIAPGQVGGKKLEFRVFQCFGMSESKIGRLLSAIALPSTITLGYRPQIPIVEVKMISRGAASADQQKIAGEIRHLLGDTIFAEAPLSLAGAIQEIMLQKRQTLTTAESCTGGMLSSALVDIAGSSDYFDRGFICYSYRSKSEILEVPAQLIQERGAVSPEVAEAMAVNARRIAKTDYALSVTGIAGPTGGTPEKPIGTVAFGLATPTHYYGQMLILPDWGRRLIREFSTAIALDMLRRHLQGKDVLVTYDLARKL